MVRALDTQPDPAYVARLFSTTYSYPQVHHAVNISSTDDPAGALKPANLANSAPSTQVVENRKREDTITRAAQAALVALERGASSRAISAAAQDTASRWGRHSDLEEIEAACLRG